MRLLLLTGTVLLPTIAAAQPVQGLYLSGSAGVNVGNTLLSSPGQTKVYVDPGPLGLAALGWGFGNGLRAEVEGSYRTDNVGAISTRRTTGSLVPLNNVSGDAKTYAVMANVAYDIPFRPAWLPAQPYVGAGFGYGWLDLDASGSGRTEFRLPGNTTSGPTPDTVSFGTAGAFAYQAMVGAAFALPEVPSLSFTLEYRFFGMAHTDIPVTRAATSAFNGVVPSASTHNRFDPLDNAVLFGMRYSFGG